MLRVAHILSRLYPYAGTEKKVIQLLNSLDENRFNSYIISLTNIWGDPSAYLNPRVQSYSLNKRKGVHLSLIFKLASLLRKLKVEIVHSHNWATLFHTVLAAKIAGVKLVIHGEHGRETRELDIKPHQLLIRRILHMGVNEFVVVSEDLAEMMINKFSVTRSKLTIIPNGVDLERFDISFDREKIRNQLGIEKDISILATIGRLKPVKDIPTIVKAFKLVHEEIEKSLLLIVGSYEDENKSELAALKELVAAHKLSKAVKFIPHTDQIPEILDIVDVYINASLTEGMSNTIMEAMTKKTPVVATRVGGNPELVKAGKTGYLFEVQDYKGCAYKILKILNNPQLKQIMGEEAFRTIQTKYNYNTMINNYQNIYLKYS